MESEKRQWGHFDVLYNTHGCKVKELVVLPGKKLSMQKHFLRSEHWFVVEGTATLYTYNENADSISFMNKYNKWEHLHIPLEQWHQLENSESTLLRIIEIQYGKECVENDILRI